MNLIKLRKIIPVRILSAGLLSLAFLIALSSAADVQYANLTSAGNVLSDSLTEQSQGFLFSDDYILWSESAGALHLYSVKENTTRRIATASAIDGYAMSDGTIVWSDDRSSLHQYTITPGKSQNIPDAKTTGSQKTYSWNGIKDIQRWAPSICGDRVVWFQGYPAGTYNNADIAFLNTTTNEMTVLNESSSAKGGLKIYGDNVVWYAYDENVTDAGRNSGIFLHNLVTGKDTVISPGPGLKRYTALSDKYIGWTDFGNPLATPIPPGQVHIYTLSSGTTQTIPGTTMNQFLDFIFGDYAVYSECTPYEIVKKTNIVSCDSKIYDIKTGNIWQLPSSKDSRTAGSSSEYDRKIVGYSDGLILVEDARGDVPVLSLFRAEDLRPAETITAVTPEPALPEKNVTSQGSTTTPVSPSQASPGFGFVGMIAALVIFCGITRKSARLPRGRS